MQRKDPPFLQLFTAATLCKTNANCVLMLQKLQLERKQNIKCQTHALHEYTRVKNTVGEEQKP